MNKAKTEPRSVQQAAEKKAETEQPMDNMAEIKEMLQRVQANFENYRKQQEKRIEEIRLGANKELILDLLPVLDHFQLALKNTEDTRNFVRGVELIHSQLLAVLKGWGLDEITVKGNNFDPSLHEALIKVESDQKEGKVVEEVQKGYLLNERVIRPAKVKVSAGTRVPEKTGSTFDGQDHRDKTDENKNENRSEEKQSENEKNEKNSEKDNENLMEVK